MSREEFAALVIRWGLTLHKNVEWRAGDYEATGDGRQATGDLDEAEAVASLIRPQGVDGGSHHLVLDLDAEHYLVPSSTPGHSHLYVRSSASWGDVVEFLEAAAKVGLIEPGYASASIARGYTAARLPWVKKGQESQRQAQTPAEVPL